MAKQISDFRALTFDCYGTMIDWESGIWDAIQPLIALNGRDDITRDKGLEAFAKIETAQEIATPGMLYPELLSQVHRAFAVQFDLEANEEMDQSFGGFSTALASISRFRRCTSYSEKTLQACHSFQR